MFQGNHSAEQVTVNSAQESQSCMQKGDQYGGGGGSSSIWPYRCSALPGPCLAMIPVQAIPSSPGASAFPPPLEAEVLTKVEQGLGEGDPFQKGLSREEDPLQKAEESDRPSSEAES